MDELLKRLLENSELVAQEYDRRANKNAKGHVWITDAKGHVIVDGSSDYHNNIKCAKCGYVYCIACHDAAQKICTK